MLYIDPSELRSNSKLKEWTAYIDDYATEADMPEVMRKMAELPGLEAKTGADVMNSPLDVPLPSTNTLLQMHIKAGASLIQIKFGHDLISSIIDGRFKEAQARMVATGAMPWQCILLFIGFTTERDGQLCMPILSRSFREYF